MALLVVGLTAQAAVAKSATNVLFWLCLENQIPPVTRLHSTALLDRMSGLKPLCSLLGPPTFLQMQKGKMADGCAACLHNSPQPTLHEV